MMSKKKYHTRPERESFEDRIRPDKQWLRKQIQKVEEKELEDQFYDFGIPADEDEYEYTDEEEE